MEAPLHDEIIRVTPHQQYSIIRNDNLGNLTIIIEGVPSGGTIWQRAKSAWKILTKSFPVSRGLLIKNCVIGHIDLPPPTTSSTSPPLMPDSNH